MGSDLPASPYLMEEPPTSPGRALLARALAHWCALSWGFSETEIFAAFEGDPQADAGVVRRVTNAARLLGEVMAAGRLRSWARPIGGGLPVPIDKGLWELDGYRSRMARSSLALAAPFDDTVAPSHWIFVELDDFNALVDQVIGDAEPHSRTGRLQRPAAEDAQETAQDPVTLQHKPERHLRLNEVLARTGWSRSTLYARIKDRRFPGTLEMTGNIAAWSEREVEEWLANPR